MDTVLVISDEPVLAEVLTEELPQYTVLARRVAEADAPCPPEVKLVIADTAEVAGIKSLETMALQVVTRPVRLRQLLYTIRGRLQAQTLANGQELVISARCSYHPQERTLNGSEEQEAAVTLTEKEGDLFSKLLDSRDKNLSREELLKGVWGYSEQVDTHTLETHIYRLRTKLKQVNSDFDILSSEEGYVLHLPD